MSASPQTATPGKTPKKRATKKSQPDLKVVGELPWLKDLDDVVEELDDVRANIQGKKSDLRKLNSEAKKLEQKVHRLIREKEPLEVLFQDQTD